MAPADFRSAQQPGNHENNSPEVKQTGVKWRQFIWAVEETAQFWMGIGNKVIRVVVDVGVDGRRIIRRLCVIPVLGFVTSADFHILTVVNCARAVHLEIEVDLCDEARQK